MSIIADQVHRNARIHTLDPARPSASVLVVAGGRVAAVGGEELLGEVGGEPEVVDHGGAVLVPVHNHHLLAGRADLYELQLDATADLHGLLDAVRAWSATLAPDAWVVGGGWGSPLIPALSDLKTLAALDEAAGADPSCCATTAATTAGSAPPRSPAPASTPAPPTPATERSCATPPPGRPSVCSSRPV
jgi:predicted amidohydrolase YtcJ